MVSSAKGVTSGGFQRRVASCRVAGVALRDISTCFMTCQKLFWQAQYFCDVFRQCIVFFVAGAALWTNVILRGRRSTLDVSCFVFSANRIVSAARSGGNVQIPWQGWHFVTGDENRQKPRNVDFAVGP